VRERLEALGHRVLAPTLTGLAERSHLLSTSLTLQTHVDDVVNLFKWEELEDVILVAHSYGGWPVSGALEKVATKVQGVVFVDAFVPDNGKRVMDSNSGQFQQQLRDALARGEAGRPVPDAKVAFGLKDAARAAWVQSLMTPQPASVATQPLALSGARDRVGKKVYVRASGFPQPRFDEYLARAKLDPAWRTYELPGEVTGHDVMVDAPELLTEILVSVGR
jgi:pimeloyl-ACP methyl ester carboxylesterase